MSHKDIIKAWKDEEFRNSLSNEQQALLPTNPAGLLELTDEALDDLLANGGVRAFDSCGFFSCNTKPSVIVDSII